MKPQFSPTQGRIARAVVLYLSRDGNKPWCTTDGRVESIESEPWSSLTFAGERHRLIIRLCRAVPAAIDGADLAVPGAIVAIERADWTTSGDGAVLTLDLLAIAATSLKTPPTR